MRRTQKQWLSLFQMQSDSHLLIRDFCLEQGISTSSFYKHKALLLPKSDSDIELSSPFSQVQLVTPDKNKSGRNTKLTVGQVKLTFTDHMDADWLAKLVGQLA